VHTCINYRKADLKLTKSDGMRMPVSRRDAISSQ
jgi:hypothetical protein